MKQIAFYLPQYHSIPENDQWWGKGFTEWTTVRNARSLFKEHKQPEIPMDNNYYCLLDDEVQEKQAKLAKQFGVYGFCYYHYWFDGKMLLEKPMENMLKNPRVDIPFCICWANETWARTWDGKNNHILIQQIYRNDKKAWDAHFKYLLPFFKDERYIKHDNKPMMIIYKPQEISCLHDMMLFWDEEAKKSGFDGVYWGFQHPSAFDDKNVVSSFDFGIEFEPLYTKKEMDGEFAKMNNREKVIYGFGHPKWLLKKVVQKIKGMPTIIDYDQVWQRIINRHPIDKKIAPGGFPSWDNTPRKGKNGIVYFEASPDKYKTYLKDRIKTAIDNYDSEYLFINAWNEWGEGAHLEPDEVNGYGYLEANKGLL